MSGVVDDLRHGVRALLRAPGFCALALVTLALGIGGTSAMFSVVYGVLYRPLPFAAPEQLVRVWRTTADGRRGSFSPGVYLDVQRESRAISGLAASIGTFASLSASGDTTRLEGAEVTANFFDLLGASAARGRVFGAGIDTNDAGLLVLSDGAWRQRFGAATDIVGRTVRLDGQPFRVVGVMPATFAYPENARFWRLARQAVPTPPLAVNGDLLTARDLGYMHVIARLVQGVTPSEAMSELRVLAGTLGERYPDDDAGSGFDVEPVYESIVGDARQSLWLLFAAVGTLLLIACTNVASLMLARAFGRRRELAVRTALGAPRGRLARQLLIESLVLALTGGALGVLVATWALEGLRAILPASIPRTADIRLDLAAVAFAVAVAMVFGLGFGTAPAWMSSTLASFDALRDGGRTSTGGRQWLRRGLVVGQVGLAVLLLSAAGVMGASLFKLQRVDVGFTAAGVVTQQLVLPQSRYDEAAQRRFYESLTDRLNQDPRVAAAAVVFPSPFVSSQASATIRLDRAAPGYDALREHSVQLGSITPRFFQAMGIPLLAGRDFVPTDLPESASSVIVNRAFADRLLGGGDVLGRRLKFGENEDEWLTVIGVVGDARSARLDTAPEPFAYLPYTHFTIPFVRLVVRGTGPEDATTDALVAAVRSEAPDLGLDPPQTLSALVTGATTEPRFRSRLVAAFAGTALGLAVLGLYSLVSYTVAGRTREIATRLALGATPASMRTGVIREGLLLTGAGLAAGLGIAAALGRLIEGLLYETTPVDPVVIGVLIAVMTGASLVACYLPARRAMRVDPMTALRAE